MEVEDVFNNADLVFVYAYGYHGSWEESTGAYAPIYPGLEGTERVTLAQNELTRCDGNGLSINGYHALLQAGAGGVGLAAGEYTHWVGTRASVTVGRPYKHWYLHGMGLRGETLSSRDGGAFLAGAAALVRASRLRFVLNS